MRNIYSNLSTSIIACDMLTRVSPKIYNTPGMPPKISDNDWIWTNNKLLFNPVMSSGKLKYLRWASKFMFIFNKGPHEKLSACGHHIYTEAA